MARKGTIPDAEDAARCIELRKQSTLGRQLHTEDAAFCVRKWREYHDWYVESEYVREKK